MRWIVVRSPQNADTVTVPGWPAVELVPGERKGSSVEVYEGVIGSLKRFKEDVREVREGYECGINVEGFNDVKVGDVIEAYKIEEVQRTLA